MESIWLWIAWHLPRGLAHWVAIRVMTEGCLGHPGEQTCGEVIARWNGDQRHEPPQPMYPWEFFG